MYQLIASDLDETLLAPGHRICQRNVDAIRAACERGVWFVCATGRGYNTVDDTLDQLGLLGQKGEYTISFNGGAITENAGNRLLSCTALDHALAEELFRRARSYDVCVHVYTLDAIYLSRYNDEERANLEGRGMPLKEVFWDDLSALADDRIMKFIFMNSDMGYLRSIASDLSDLAPQLAISYSSNRYLELNPRGVDKGAGLARLAGILGIDMADTIAIGDNLNDLPMIRAAGLGAGVANARPEMRPDLDYLAEADNAQGGVAEVIEKFVLGGLA